MALLVVPAAGEGAWLVAEVPRQIQEAVVAWGAPQEHKSGLVGMFASGVGAPPTG